MIDVKRIAIVAIPSKNEARWVPGCLEALDRQIDASGDPLPRHVFGVILFANNCDDDSAAIARSIAAQSRFEIRVVEAQLPSEIAHAGGARRTAMDLADAWLEDMGVLDGVLLTTDADSRVTPHWIQANLAAIADGADAVLGRITLDEDGALLPAALHARGKLEAVYEDLLAEIAARLDPEDCNPWPHHQTISGASLALTQRMYRRLGGLPCVPLGEDKALVDALRRNDARLRFAPDVVVETSGRTIGRAPGGVADTLKLRSDDLAALCDEALEPCVSAYRRALWRHRLRQKSALGAPRWRRALGVSESAASWIASAPTFGELWRRVELSSPVLVRRRLPPQHLPREIELATRYLRRLQALSTPFQDVDPEVGPAIRELDLDAAV